MPSITKQVQNLVEQGSTEEALETLVNWLRNEHSMTLNEVILLRSRYEQVERELGLDLVSPEDAARSYNQINFALLNLVQNLEKPLPTAAPTTNRKGWLIAGAGALLIIVLLMFVLKVLLPSRELPASPQNKQTRGSNLEYPQGKEVSLSVNENTAIYKLIEGRAEPYNPENQKITLKIRCFMKGRYDMNFWESDFQLIANELPYAAQGGLNEVVSADTFKDGEVYFLIPKEVQKADLRIKFYDQYTVLPLKW